MFSLFRKLLSRGPDLVVKPFLHKPMLFLVCRVILLKTLWKREKLLKTNNTSFLHSVCYPFGEISNFFIKIKIVICKILTIWIDLKFVSLEKVKSYCCHCCMVVWWSTHFLTVFQLHFGSQCTYPCFPGFFLNSTSHNSLSKPLAAFLYNHCQNDGQRWERNESCHKDYHQSLERILAEAGIKPVTSCSQVVKISFVPLLNNPEEGFWKHFWKIENPGNQQILLFQ